MLLGHRLLGHRLLGLTAATTAMAAVSATATMVLRPIGTVALMLGPALAAVSATAAATMVPRPVRTVTVMLGPALVRMSAGFLCGLARRSCGRVAGRWLFTEEGANVLAQTPPHAGLSVR